MSSRWQKKAVIILVSHGKRRFHLLCLPHRSLGEAANAGLKGLLFCTTVDGI
jgi:hypothetical protein